jgi:hypothetical protein
MPSSPPPDTNFRRILAWLRTFLRLILKAMPADPEDQNALSPASQRATVLSRHLPERIEGEAVRLL